MIILAIMSCYTRHLDELIDRLGLENTKENRKLLDLKIREAFSIPDLDCPAVWKDFVKPRLSSEAGFEELISKIKEVL